MKFKIITISALFALSSVSFANNKIWIEPGAGGVQVFEAMFGMTPNQLGENYKKRMVIRHNNSATGQTANVSKDFKVDYKKSLVLPIEFSFDSKELTSESKQFLDHLYSATLAVPKGTNNEYKTSLDVSGHTDSIGPANYNQTLSQIRAETVKSYLIEKGFAAEMIKTNGYGEMQLLDKQNSSNSKNRRVEINAKIVKIASN